MDPAIIEVALNIGFPAFLLVSTYFIGNRVERSHFDELRKRERKWQRLPALTFRTPPASWQVQEGSLVTGSVVVSVDYFKRFLANLRRVIGGRVKSYEGILDRARREALLRMKADALSQGYTAVINVRLETTRMANTARNGKGTAGLEILAYGTGLKVHNDPA